MTPEPNRDTHSSQHATVHRVVRTVAVFAGAGEGARTEYKELAYTVGSVLAQQGITVVYGGGGVGLMGAVAEGALSAGGEVVGVIPESLVVPEAVHLDLSRLEVVPSLLQRKERMAELADAFLALPGGGGTLNEVVEMWTWRQMGMHDKPVGLIDSVFWAPLMALVGSLVQEGFVRAEGLEGLVVCDRPESVVARLRGLS